MATIQIRPTLLRVWLGEDAKLHVSTNTRRTERDEIDTEAITIHIRATTIKVYHLSCFPGLTSLHEHRSWPGISNVPSGEEAPYHNTIALGLENQWSWSLGERVWGHANIFATPTCAPYQPQIQAPPRCRLPSSIRFTAVLMYITFAFCIITTTSAIPLSVSHARMHLQNRQSIPDQFGNTGNQPGPLKSQPPPFAPTPTVTPFTSTPTSSTVSFSASQPTSTLTTGSNGSSNNGGGSGGGLGLNPNPSPPAPELQVTSPQPNLSPGTIAGIVSGGVLFLLTTVAVGVFIYRRTRRPEINEIPIRRSKLGTGLGRRMLGSLSSSRSPSRADSRSSSRASLTGDGREKGVEAGWLDKRTISRPKAAWLEGGLLSVPKPAFMREEKETVENDGKWIHKGAIGAPRPRRPASAEPLGRLSGMGMGMGYLK